MIIKNGKLVLEDRIIDGSVEFNGGRITSVGGSMSDSDSLDASGLYVCPGFVDIHSHGGGGIDFMDNCAFDKALQFHAEYGTTSMLPTALTSPPTLIRDFCDKARAEWKVSPVERKGCRMLGVHIEGPYLSLKNKGAQPESYLLTPSKDSYDFLLDNADIIKIVTLSPELDGMPKMVRDLRERGIVVSGGHDNGKKSTLVDSLSAGITHLTHLWCAMSTVMMYDGLREPGLVEIGLTDDSISVEIIADNHHMPPELVKVVYRCKGAKMMCVVSDCLRAGGMPQDGKLWTLGREGELTTQFIVSDGVARLPDNTRLAGSIQPLSQMVRNLVVDADIPLVDAVRMASLSPAEVIGVEGEYGSIEVGKTADFCLMDEGFNVRAVFIDGVRIK